MFDRFEAHITSAISLTEEELKLMRSLSTEKKLRRRQLLLREGEICRFKAFVVKGLLRNYCTKDDGTEYNMRFSAENKWTIEPESYNNQTPSRYSIEAVEDTEVVLWNQENMEKIFEAIPSFRAYSERLKANSLHESQNRILMSISSTVEERYQEFTRTYPDVFARIPLHMVATYLGVSRETLTRVRHARLHR